MAVVTLREHLEAIRELAPKRGKDCVCPACQINEHAVAALAILDAAPSYDDIVFYGSSVEFIANEPTQARLIPDPEDES